MKKHIDLPAGWLFTTSGCGASGAILCQYGEIVPGLVLGMIAAFAFVVGAARTRVFWR